MRREADGPEHTARGREVRQERSLERGGQSDPEPAQQRVTIESRAPEDRRARRAVENFARFEREVGRLQERARRVVAALAAEEVDRGLEDSIAPMLRQLEARLTEIVRGASDPRPSARVVAGTVGAPRAQSTDAAPPVGGR
jgi:hypothetical protein